MIIVFKTSVNTSEKVRHVKPYLDKLLPGARWNFDLEDCDKILRIESADDVTQLVILELIYLGYDCQELP